MRPGTTMRAHCEMYQERICPSAAPMARRTAMLLFDAVTDHEVSAYRPATAAGPGPQPDTGSDREANVARAGCRRRRQPRLRPAMRRLGRRLGSFVQWLTARASALQALAHYMVT